MIPVRCPHRLALILAASVAVTGCALTPAASRHETPEQQPKVAPPAVRMSPFAFDPVASITEATVRAHLTFLASDAMNGRGSGTRDEWIAATYLGAQMQQWGLEPLGDDGGFVQRIEIERFETAAPPTLAAGGARYVHGRDLLVMSAPQARVSGPLQRYVHGAPVRAGSVLLLPERSALGSSVAPDTAGAALVLVPETPLARKYWTEFASRNPAPAPRLVGAANKSPATPAVALDKATFAALSALADGAPISLDLEVKRGATTTTWNAVGRLPGSDPAAAAEVILLSAHLDHVGNQPARAGDPDADTIYNGADDDASGSVAVLELARALAQGPRPRRTIVFAFFGSEEEGGFGSRYFADRPVVPLEQIVANLQFEMIGRPDPAVPPKTLWLTGYERSNLGPALAARGARLVQDPHPEQNFFTRSDNIAFARRGVVAHTVSSYGLHEEYHQPSDEVQLVDLAHMTEAIRSLFEPIRWLADSTFRPEWAPGGRPH